MLIRGKVGTNDEEHKGRVEGGGWGGEREGGLSKLTGTIVSTATKK